MTTNHKKIHITVLNANQIVLIDNYSIVTYDESSDKYESRFIIQPHTSKPNTHFNNQAYYDRNIINHLTSEAISSHERTTINDN